MLANVRKLFVAVAVLGYSVSAQSPKELQVFDLSSHANRSTVAHAAKAYNDGQIIRMSGANEADVVRLFGSKLGTFKVFQTSREQALRKASAGESLKLHGVAGYKDTRGVVHTVQSFAPESSSNATGNTAWSRHLDE